MKVNLRETMLLLFIALGLYATMELAKSLCNFPVLSLPDWAIQVVTVNLLTVVTMVIYSHTTGKGLRNWPKLTVKDKVILGIGLVVCEIIVFFPIRLLVSSGIVRLAAMIIGIYLMNKILAGSEKLKGLWM